MKPTTRDMDTNDMRYSNREIDEWRGDVKDTLGRIETQTIQHNGRLKKSELWQAYMTGGIAVLALLVVPMLAWAVFTLVNIDHRIQESVDSALSAYDISNED